jgi:hypothetical protein
MSTDQSAAVNHGRGIGAWLRTRDARYVYVLRLSDPDDVDHLCDFLRRVRVAIDVRPDGTVSAAVVAAPMPPHELRELTGYVATWNALDASTVELLDTPR